ncbi:MAG TPA: ribonuclease [Allosphingosinicella sp.]|nr:ribonuclease [Allosphingosinicella sp.]
MALQALMAEWYFEQGIGEDRAILVEGDAIVEASLELPGLRAGAVLEARLAAILIPGRRAIVSLASGGDALLEPVPAELSEGQAIRVEIVREPIAESGRAKLAKCRLTDAAPCAGPALRERISRFGQSLAKPPVLGRDVFEEAGWSELLEQAMSGDIPFTGGALRMSLTPAMTLFDVDGALSPPALAVAGAAAAGRAIRRFAVAGSIGIDLPTLAARADRQAAAAALDQVLPQPFERTAVNGFGFLQIVRRRERASIAESLQGDPIGAAARALLRRAERVAGTGERILHAAPSVVARIEANPLWLAELGRRTGTAIALRADPALGLPGGHVQSAFA